MKARHRIVSHFTLALALAPLLAAGCGGDECGPGYAYQGHACIATFQAPAGGAPNAGGAAGDAGASGGPSCDSTFGASCFVHEDCSCDAEFCAGYPGEEGICTRTGCLEDASVCPADWGCMDLSSILAGLPAICTPPAE